MARTVTAPELAILQSSGRFPHARLLLEDPDGVMQDVTDLAGEDWFDGAEISAHVDEPISGATLHLRREIAGTSLSPLIEASPLNREGGTLYAPFAYAARKYQVLVAPLPAGQFPDGSTEWTVLAEGTTDRIRFGGKPPQMSLEGRDQIGRLHDTLIETVSTYGDDDSPVPIANVMQQILDNGFGSGTFPLNVIGTPSFGIREYELGNVTHLEGLTALRDLIGWNLHSRFNEGAGEFQVTFYEPQRNSTTAQHTLGPDDYYDVSDLGIDKTRIRNAGELLYKDVNGAEQKVTAERPVSIDLYKGRRFIRFDERGNPQIQTQAEAQNMLDAALDDLESPPALQTIECAFWWPIELGDIIEFLPNGKHYDVAQKWAVVSYRHVFDRGRPRTYIDVRGKPSGGFERWHRRTREEREEVGPRIASIVDRFTADGLLFARVTALDAASVRLAASTTDFPDEAAVDAATPVNLGAGGIAEVATGLDLDPGQHAFLSAKAYSGPDGAGQAGELAQVQVTFSGGTADRAGVPTIQEKVRQVGSTGFLELVINDPELRVTDVLFKTQSGGTVGNLLPFPEDFSQWVTSNSPSVTGGQPDPFGGTNAFLLATGPTPGLNYQVRQDNVGFAFQDDKGFSIFTKKPPNPPPNGHEVFIADPTQTPSNRIVRVDWGAGAAPILSTPNDNVDIVAVKPEGDGWYRLVLTADDVSTDNAVDFRININGVLSQTGDMLVFGATAHDQPVPGAYRAGDADLSDPTDGTWTSDPAAPFEASVGLVPKHTSVIGYAVEYTDFNNVTRYIQGGHTFDLNRTANVQNIAVSFDATGDIVVSASGDEDVARIYVTAQQGSPPPDPTAAANDGVIDAREGTVDTGIACALGQVAFVRVVGENHDGALGPVYAAQLRRGVGEKLPFTWALDPDQVGSTGQFRLTITDSTKAVTAVEYQVREGATPFGGTWLSAWDTSTGTAGTDASLFRQKDVALSAKHTSTVKARISYTDENGTPQTTVIAHTFDLDHVAEVIGVSITLDGNQAPVVTVHGDADVRDNGTDPSFYLTVGIDAVPPDPSAGVNDGIITLDNVRSGTVTADAIVSPGTTANIKVVAVNHQGEFGPVAGPFQFRAPTVPTWTEVYSVSFASPATLLGADGTPIGLGTYSVNLRNIESGAGETSSWVLTLASGGSSFLLIGSQDHPDEGNDDPELFLDAGVPKVRLSGGTNTHDVLARVEIGGGLSEAADRALVPTVKEEVRQVGSTGFLAVTVNDPEDRVNRVLFRAQAGPGNIDLSDPTDGNWTEDPGPVFEESVALVPKHTSVIGYAVGYFDADNIERFIAGAHTFDLDRIAEVQNIALSFGDDGDVVVSASGDEDATSLHVTAAQDTAPPDPTAGANDGTIVGRSGTVDTGVQIALGAVAHVKVVAEDSQGALGPVHVAQLRRGVAANLPFRWALDPEQVGTTGQFRLTITDQTLSVTDVEFQVRSGAGGYGGVWLSSWDTSTGTPGTNEQLFRQKNIQLAGKHTSSVKARISYTAEDGTPGEPVVVAHTFDLDEVAEVIGVQVEFADQGFVDVIGTFDEDARDDGGVSAYVTVGVNTDPPDPTAALNDGEIILGGLSRTGRVTTPVQVPPGAIAHVKIVALNSQGEFGPVVGPVTHTNTTGGAALPEIGDFVGSWSHVYQNVSFASPATLTDAHDVPLGATDGRSYTLQARNLDANNARVRYATLHSDGSAWSIGSQFGGNDVNNRPEFFVNASGVPRVRLQGGTASQRVEVQFDLSHTLQPHENPQSNDGRFEIDYVNALLTVRDEQVPQRDRIYLGKLPTGVPPDAYGIEVFDANGNLVLGAAGLGPNSVGTIQIVDLSVLEDKLADLAVTTAKLRDNSVLEEKLADLAVTTAKIRDNAVLEQKLADLAVTQAKLADNSVLEQKLADLAVTQAKIADNSVLEQKLADLAVTTDKLANDSVLEEKLADLAVTQQKLADLAVSQRKMASGLFVPEIVNSLPPLPDPDYPEGATVVLTTDHKLYRSTGGSWTAAVPTGDLIGSIGAAIIENGSITTVKLDDAAVTTEKVAGGAITTAKIGGAAVTTSKIAGSAITTAKIGNLSVTTEKLGNASIVTAKVGDLAITATKLADGSVVSDKLFDGAVLEQKLADLAVTQQKLANNSVLEGKLADLAVTTQKLANNAVVQGKLADFAVTAPKIDNGAVLEEKLANLAVSTQKLANDAVVQGKLADFAVTGPKIANDAVDRAKVANYAIGGSQIDGMARGQHGVFMESFEESPGSWQQFGGGSFFRSGEQPFARTGGHVLQVDSPDDLRLVFPENIPFDASKLYRIRARARAVQTGDAANQRFFAGMHGVSHDGVSWVNVFGADSIASQHYVAAQNFDLAANPGWNDFTGWFQGWGATDAENIGNNSPTQPAKLHPSVRYIRPMFIANYQGAAAGNRTQIDYIAIDVFDEDGSVRTYQGLNVDGVVAADKVVSGSIVANAIATVHIQAGAVDTAQLRANAVVAGKIAANTIRAGDIQANAITGSEINAGAVNTGHLAAEAVTAGKIAADSIGTRHIVAGAVEATQLAAEAITAGKIATNQITAAHIQGGAIEASHISADAVTASKIAAGSINTAHIQAGAITASELAANSVTTGSLQSGIIQAQHIQTNAVTANEIAVNTIVAANIAAGAIGASEIAADAVTASKIAANTIVAANIAAGAIGTSELRADSVTADQIASNTIVAGNIAAGAIGTSEIHADAVTADHIRAGQIDTFHLVTGAVTAGKIAANTIRAGDIQANAITGSELAADSVTANAIAAGVIQAVHISAGAVDTEELAAGAVTAGKIFTNAVRANHIRSGEVDTVHLKADAVTASKIAAGSITTAHIQSGAVDTVELKADAVTAGKIATNAVRANHIRSGEVDTVHLNADSITAAKIAAGSIQAQHIQANAVTANKINVGSLSAIAANIGTVTAGRLRNASGNAEIRLSGGGPIPLHVIDFTATGDDILIGTPGLIVKANGDASFFGTVQASAVVASTSFTGSSAHFSGNFFSVGNTFEVDQDTPFGPPTIRMDGDVTIATGHPIELTGNGSSLSNEAVIVLDRVGTVQGNHIGYYNQNIREFLVGMGIGTNEVLEWKTGGGTSLMRLWKGGGGAIGDLDIRGDYGNFSPAAPKPDAEMGATDWLEWASGEACKPHLPYEGMPGPLHPLVAAEAEERGCSCDDVADEHRQRYRKSISKMATGTTRWAGQVQQALSEASDFDDFRKRLGAIAG